VSGYPYIAARNSACGYQGVVERTYGVLTGHGWYPAPNRSEDPLQFGVHSTIARVVCGCGWCSRWAPEDEAESWLRRHYENGAFVEPPFRTLAQDLRDSRVAKQVIAAVILILFLWSANLFLGFH
jgi:hypothetical protein